MKFTRILFFVCLVFKHSLLCLEVLAECLLTSLVKFGFYVILYFIQWWNLKYIYFSTNLRFLYFSYISCFQLLQCYLLLSLGIISIILGSRSVKVSLFSVSIARRPEPSWIVVTSENPPQSARCQLIYVTSSDRALTTGRVCSEEASHGETAKFSCICITK